MGFLARPVLWLLGSPQQQFWVGGGCLFIYYFSSRQNQQVCAPRRTAVSFKSYEGPDLVQHKTQAPFAQTNFNV